MDFKLDHVVPWGRGFEEYRSMFSLSEEDLHKKLLGCGEGPSSFNARVTAQGGTVISFDPIYRFSENQIRTRINEIYPKVLEYTRTHSHQFDWTRIGSIENLGLVRMQAMNEFLIDYSAGVKEGRYVEASLPCLPFGDNEFDLSLCSHVLFLYSDHFSLKFHVDSIRELCRVSSETRIFPLLDLSSKQSIHLDETMLQLRAEGFNLRVETVPYEFQKGGNQMLRVKTHE